MYKTKFLIKFFLVISGFVSFLNLSVINLSASQLDLIIPAEIKNDSLYDAIYELSKNEDIKTILEIGSSSGRGSTEAFVAGIRENPNKPTLFCMEVSKNRYQSLIEYYGKETQIKAYNVSSIPISSFPSEQEITDFYNTTLTSLHDYPLTDVLSWLKTDIDYIKTSKVPQNGIRLIKKINNIENFDMVLIDGSEFAGKAELKLVYGARFIFLDDINAFKNYENFNQLINDSNYQPLDVNYTLRYGYAIFEKIDL